MRSSVRLILVLLLSITPVAAQTAQNPAPTVDELNQMLADGKSQEVIRGVARCLSLKGAASQPYDRFDLYMLRGQAYLQAKATQPAIEAFVAAQKETDDKNKKLIARADELLVRASKGGNYTPKAASTSSTPPGAGEARPAAAPISIFEKDGRHAAMEAFFNDQADVAQRKVEALKRVETLQPMLEGLQTLGDLRAVEYTSTGGKTDRSKQLASGLGAGAHKLLSMGLGKLEEQADKISDEAQSHSIQQTSIRQSDDQTTMRGLTSMSRQSLKEINDTAEKIANVAGNLADSTSMPEFEQDATHARAIQAKVKSILEYNYAGVRTAGSNTPAQTPRSTGNQPPRGRR